MTRTILVIGSNGMLGYAVSEYFSRRGDRVIGITRAEFDIVRNPITDLSLFIEEANLVINCAGVIKQVIQDKDIQEILKVNAIFPLNLAFLCNEHGTPCIHITTDCVFTGMKGGYSETDIPDADDVYGMSKNAGDSADCMVLRTSIIGEDRGGHGLALLPWVQSQKGGHINGYTNHLWNGVTTVYLAEIIDSIIEKDLYQKGIFHIFSPEVVSKYELVSKINTIYGLEIEITKYETEVPCDRSLTTGKGLSHMVATKALHDQILEMKDFFSSD